MYHFVLLLEAAARINRAAAAVPYASLSIHKHTIANASAATPCRPPQEEFDATEDMFGPSGDFAAAAPAAPAAQGRRLMVRGMDAPSPSPPPTEGAAPRGAKRRYSSSKRDQFDYVRRLEGESPWSQPDGALPAAVSALQLCWHHTL